MFRINLIFFLILAPFSLVNADMGAIVPVENVDLQEPAQRAIIAHDGFEEILILGVDLNASSPVGALRFIPLPSEPKVSLAPNNCFDSLSNLVKEHNLRYVFQSKGLVRISTGESVELRFHKKLGAHDITVIKVNDSLHFRKWVNDYFNKMGLPQRDKYIGIENIVADYVEREIPFFVFDFVQLSAEVNSINPIVYQFNSRKLYYPLKVTNIIGGSGKVELFIFSENGRRSIGQYTGHNFQASTTAIVTSDEIISIYPTINDLLGKRSILQAFKYDGELKFKGDILEDIDLRELEPYNPEKKATSDK